MSTVGMEHEWSDVDRRAEIPPHLGKWSVEDYSIVNSDGHANCPTGATWRWGGEINTTPTDSPRGQADIARELIALLNPTINYKSNLHVHVAPEIDLLADLPKLKLVARMLREAEPFVWANVDPLIQPTSEMYPDYEVLKGAIKRWNRNKSSHHGSLKPIRFEEQMMAMNVQQFKDAHAPPTSTGGRAWHITSRCGINLRSLWKHGTIEFRHFHGTLVPEEIEDSGHWCQALLDEIVGCARYRPDASGADIAAYVYGARRGGWRFPTPIPYDHQLALGFERTKFRK